MNLISRAELNSWLDALAKGTTLIAPLDVEGVSLYRPVKSSQEIDWRFTRPILSIKNYFFPTTERLLVIKKTGQEILLTETLPECEQVIFGVRPCDARGLKTLDALFLDKQPRDPYYSERRENTTLIGLACQEMGSSCFCTSLGGSPDNASDVDLMLTELKDGYGIQAVTEKGQALLEGVTLKILPGQPPEPRLNDRLSVPGIKEWPARFNDPYWMSMAEGCLSCRICAYACPTCRCFAVRDEAVPSSNGNRQYERLRCWDSCAGEAYRRIAGGHNPRSVKGERLRNRFFCKFYYYPKQYGLGEIAACTGCGRCIDACPVGIDITEVLQHMAEVSQ